MKKLWELTPHYRWINEVYRPAYACRNCGRTWYAIECLRGTCRRR